VRELPFTVDIPVPGDGLGRRMDRIANWLGTNAKGYWAQHGKMVEREHVARYYFSSPWDAQNFEDWLKDEAIV
ncbi:MAG: hypothetical protein AAFY56_11040, partial [Pseudomonadota bacterium]